MIIHIFLKIYVNILTTLESIGLQTIKTLTAIKNSFKEDHLQLVFFEGSIIPQVSSYNIFSNSEKQTWIYDTKKKTFTYKSYYQTSRHLPYISMSIQHNIYTEDLSEWIESVRVVSPVEIVLPVHIIITCWAFSQEKSLDYSLDNYKIRVITDDADEIVM